VAVFALLGMAAAFLAIGAAPGAHAALGDMTTFVDPGGAASTDIAAGPDGNVWFTTLGSDRIGRITPTGTITTFVDPGGAGSTSDPVGIVAGPDGNIWYTNAVNHRIGRLDPAAGNNAAIATSITTFADPSGTSSTNGPLGITAGPDGNLWYTSTHLRRPGGHRLHRGSRRHHRR